MPLHHEILKALSASDKKPEGLTSKELAARVSVSWSTLKRHLDTLIRAGDIARERDGRSMRYRLATPGDTRPFAVTLPSAEQPQLPWSAESKLLRVSLSRPLAMREPVSYHRALVDDYIPNHTAWLPPALAATLEAEGRMRGQQAAGTYARKVLEPLLIDLSWSSSRLEGNRYSLLATEELFKSGQTGGDVDAVMLLNHKSAIEFLVDAVPEYGLTTALVSNLHTLLMVDLLADSSALGSIRQTVVNISDTVYIPSQVPLLLEEMLELVIEKARQTKSPTEAAFFLWINLAYLQPFEDGNKRTSRLCANIPLMLYNCAPLSFLDVSPQDYAMAMMGVYEQRNMAMAVDLFEWVYRRSIKKYAVTLESMGVPDPIRLQFRELLNEAMGSIVRDGKSKAQAVLELELSDSQQSAFSPLLDREVEILNLHNCARYRLSLKQVEKWIAAGRPG
ncbi:MAG TPA: Fic family protein [Pseudomonas sp.]|uniref:Fic family protein n=1 Tax=Pseudomonas sp. TaxID=306 RepID=UPI002B464E47|nr:Fic family protein [Pseudomonas sp.]HKS13673.1 Fic family protein [Pseudomonas sp.]